jgi:hypothetical protein
MSNAWVSYELDTIIDVHIEVVSYFDEGTEEGIEDLSFYVSKDHEEWNKIEFN